MDGGLHLQKIKFHDFRLMEASPICHRQPPPAREIPENHFVLALWMRRGLKKTNPCP
jgi:hypothetical protein